MKLRLICFSLILTLLASTEGRLNVLSYGGAHVRASEFPYMALLSYTDDSQQCGASIIHERWAVTAAHCLIPKPRYGGITLIQEPYLAVGTIKNDRSGTFHEVEKLYVHPNYTRMRSRRKDISDYIVNDIGLIRLSSNITFNDNVQPIKLAMDEPNDYENAIATTMGWGSDRVGYPTSKTLRFIKIRVLIMEKCRESWFYADKHICTSSQEGQGICHGDSGSPLVVDGVQIGVVSASDPYCKSLLPDLYTKVSSFVPWIKETLDQYGDKLISS